MAVETSPDVVRRAIAGDARAFETLMRETTNSVRTVVRSYVKNADDVSDVVQEVFLRALQRLSTLDDPERFVPWVYAIARNAGLDYVRRARRRGDRTDDGVELEVLADGRDTPDELAEVRDLADQVQAGLARLAPRDATLLAMVTTLGFTPTDVAGALGMTPTAAKVAVHRARQRLRNAMLLSTTVPAGATAMVPAGGYACAVFAGLISSSDLVEAAIHARGCTVCGKPVAATQG
jgi:RNA polymerase sigma-70 factor, ECF subfamily